MKCAIDVQYIEGKIGVSSLVGFESWHHEKVTITKSTTLFDIKEYIPGEFYKKELPCILSVLKELEVPPEIIIIDGYVYLDENKSSGLGAYLYEALGQKVPVIGVAKNSFKGSPHADQVFRGNSKKPLYVTAAGIDSKVAAENIRKMHGDYRFPTLLKEVDSLARELAKEIEANQTL